MKTTLAATVAALGLSLAGLNAQEINNADFPKLEKSAREIALLFPPGEGTVYIKGK